MFALSDARDYSFSKVPYLEGVSWYQWYHVFIGFVVLRVSLFDRFHGILVSKVSQVSLFHRFPGVNGFMIS